MFATRYCRSALLALAAVGTVACSSDSINAPDSPLASGGQGASRNVVSTAGVAQVYGNDFSGPVGIEWTNARSSMSPSGEMFLGEFSNETTALQLNNLAAHDSVTVTLDLYIIRSWDGVDPTAGPDNFTMTADGVTLLNTTFSNMHGKFQNYPHAAGERKAVWRHGAEATNSLGFMTPSMMPLDATYHLTFTFAHVSSSLNLSLAAIGLQDIADESWGVDNVKVSIR